MILLDIKAGSSDRSVEEQQKDLERRREQTKEAKQATRQAHTKRSRIAGGLTTGNGRDNSPARPIGATDVHQAAIDATEAQKKVHTDTSIFSSMS